MDYRSTVIDRNNIHMKKIIASPMDDVFRDFNSLSESWGGGAILELYRYFIVSNKNRTKDFSRNEIISSLI